MGWSKTTRISVLLVIDISFLVLELAVGLWTHSLALIADAFHMLNDVLSLVVGLWAVRIASKQTNSKQYTYGWQRAETLGALVNGIFLVALCVSIFLQSIERFIEKPVVKNPMWVMIVGCLGLASNIVGLLLFHDHGHGGHGHSHGSAEGAAEEGHAHSHADHEEARVADQSGNVVDVLPQNRIAGWPQTKSPNSEQTAVETGSPVRHTNSAPKHGRSRSRAYSNVDDIPVNPNAFRRSIIEASRMNQIESDEGSDNEDTPGSQQSNQPATLHPQQPLLNGKQTDYGSTGGSNKKRRSITHHTHNHAKPKDAAASSGGHGHSHGDLNMRGIFLHVMGDALGNIGVIGSAAFIWKTTYSWRMYVDPAVSVVIACIILGSAIPLCKAASRILLQAVPAGISIDDIKDDIEDLPGILSCHHLHVWQLSDVKLVASLHVQVEFDFKGDGSARYMELAQAIRKCLHEYGIHSSTIQPEFCLDPEHDHASDSTAAATGGGSGEGAGSRAASVRDADACLLECGDDCGEGKGCCPPRESDNA